MAGLLKLTFCSFLVHAAIFVESSAAPSFTIDYDNNQFLKDGKPFRYLSGSLHYFRVPRIYWADRLNKFKAAGLNAIQTYIDWSQHEPYPGQYNFEDNLDLLAFLRLAQKTGLLVVLRPGPFIDAERDMGGFPFWLLQSNPAMKLRSFDLSYLKHVDHWFSKVLPMVKPLLYENGGPIISVQVENEYGSYFACDSLYMKHLRDLFRNYLGQTVVLFTTDGGNEGFLKCGKTDGIYATVDFGPGTDVKAAFAAQRKYEPKGPLVNSEYYPGWLDHWGYPHANPSINSTLQTLEEILQMNASVNLYMFHGGTNFGFTNGANLDSEFYAIPTSYDYNAPLSEAGDATAKYSAIRNVLLKYSQTTPPPVPPAIPKYAYGYVQLKQLGSLFHLLPLIRSHQPIQSINPLTFEELGQAYGFVLYETVLDRMVMDPALLIITGIKDRGLVFIEEVFAGILSRQDSIYSLPITILKGQRLSILVENQGRICFGAAINDIKGITSNVTLGGNVLTGWTNNPLPFNDTNWLYKVTSKLSESDGRFGANFNGVKTPLNFPGQYSHSPGLFVGKFVVPNNSSFPLDTFLRFPDGWYKGLVIVNNFNIGRYWPIVGPQVTLYIPKNALKPYPEVNQILILELEKSPCRDRTQNCEVELVDKHVLDGPTPHDAQQYGYTMPDKRRFHG